MLSFSLFSVGMLFFLWTAPWQAMECGADEGMEFSKMLLLLRHHELLNLAWNDQPWFYSQVFTSIFNITGFICGIPRLATFLVTLGMFLSFRRLMPTGAGSLHLLCSWAFFLCFADMLPLSVSAMLEMPAFGLATIAVALTPRKLSEWHFWRFCCAGILLAVAVQIKLTAAIVLPGFAAEMAAAWRREEVDICRPSAIRLLFAPILGLGVFGLMSTLIVWWSPSWNWSMLVDNHLTAGATSQAAKLRFDWTTLLQSPGTVAAAILGLVLLGRQRRLSEATYIIGLIGTVLLIHTNHRPWWDYYQIHFAVPLAILGGWGAGELLRIARAGSGGSGIMRGCFLDQDAAMMLGCLTVALWVGCELPRGYANAWSLQEKQRIADSEEVRILRKYQPRANWAYTRLNNLAAQSGLTLPPELTILPQKRFWTGEATEISVLDTVKRYQCDVLVLMTDVELKQKAWSAFLMNYYVNVWSDRHESIFVAKRLNPIPQQTKEKILERLGI